MENSLYAWFDTEYSSLDLEKAVILQVALLITDSNLERVLPAERDVRLTVKLPEGAPPISLDWQGSSRPGLSVRS